MSLSRRGFLGLLGGVGGAAAVGAVAVPWMAAPAEIGSQVRSGIPLPPPYRVPLPVPPVAAIRADGDTDHVEITQRRGTAEILPGVRTEVWGYDGRFPGPTIVSRTGRRTVVHHRNELPVPTVVHLHGGHTPADQDGYPTDLVIPAGIPARAAMDMQSGHMRHGDDAMPMDRHPTITMGARDYAYPNRQRATTLWYHDHRMGFTGATVWRGLAGFHLVHDAEEDALPLPRGDRDIPLMIADRAFDEHGQFSYPALDPSLLGTPGVTESAMQGVLGDVILVNGAPWPELAVPAVRYRFRLLNASNARRYRLALAPGPAGGGGLVQVGSDGGLLERPVTHDAIDIAPAERFDVVIDFSRYRPGQTIELVNRLGSGGTARVMRFRVTGRAADDSAVPSALAAPEPLPASTRTRDFVFRNGAGHTWKINGQGFDPNTSIADPALGSTETWRFATDFHHPIHLHLVQFKVLSRDGHGPGRYDAGWKDTVDAHPAELITVAARFADYRGRYLLHCHNLEHEDMAMMATYRVV